MGEKVTRMPEQDENDLARRGTNPPAIYVTVAPPPLLKVHLGDTESLGRYVRTRSDATAAVWDETGLRVILGDAFHVLTYQPEITQEAEQFFRREERRHTKPNGELGPKIWDGDFEPVKFLRSKLRQFLEAHASDVPPDVVASLSRLKLTASDEESGDDGRLVTVSAVKSNFPRRFGVTLEVFPGVATRLEFEATPCSMREEYSGRSGTMGMELRCLNARRVLREAMGAALAELPDGIPRYYGRSPVPGSLGGRGDQL